MRRALGVQAKKICVLRHEHATALGGKGQLSGIIHPQKSRLRRRRRVNAPAAETCRHASRDVFIQMEADWHLSGRFFQALLLQPTVHL